MRMRQLSLFLENRPGQLLGPCRLLVDAGIQIWAMSLVDTERFGILRMIVSDWQAGEALLKQAGFVVTVTEVLVTRVNSGQELLALLELLATEEINLEYLYGFTAGGPPVGLLVLRVAEIERAEQVMQKAAVPLLGEADFA